MLCENVISLVQDLNSSRRVHFYDDNHYTTGTALQLPLQYGKFGLRINNTRRSIYEAREWLTFFFRRCHILVEYRPLMKTSLHYILQTRQLLSYIFSSLWYSWRTISNFLMNYWHVMASKISQVPCFLSFVYTFCRNSLEIHKMSSFIKVLIVFWVSLLTRPSWNTYEVFIYELYRTLRKLSISYRNAYYEIMRK